MPKTIKLPGSCLSSIRLWGALALLLVTGWLGNVAQAATTFLGPVNASADEADALPGDGICRATGGNYCTLRAAIQESNALFPKGVTDITITVNTGTYFLGLTGADDDAAATGDLDILGTCPSADINLPCLKIEGNGKGDTIIDGKGMARVFHFVGKNTVKITGVTIQNGGVTNENGGGIKNSNGWVTLENCAITQNTIGNTTGARYGGGGIYNAFGGRMVINGCTISGNKVNNTQGMNGDDYIFGVGGGGGGISNVGVMTIKSTTIQDNLGRPLGGGIMNVSGFVGESGKLTIISSTLQGNKNAKDDGTPNGVGGALSNQGGLVSIKQSIISGNTAREGGGVFNTNSAAGQGTISGSVSIIASLVDNNIGNGLSNKDAMEVRYSTISNNKAQPFDTCTGGSGGCTNGADGGGINNYGPGELTVENTTITLNTARNGGGINNGRAMALTSITISDNTATNADGGKEIFINIQDIVSNPAKFKTVLLSNIIGGNGVASSNNCSGGTVGNSDNTLVNADYLKTITSKGYNLENGNSCGLKGAGDLNANPNLGALADNGGGTQTILPGGVYPKNFMPGSPAIGKGACPSPAFDQRQFGRPGTDRVCDIGAVESDGDKAVQKVDLEVQKTANVPSVVLNGPIIYTLTVTNHGPGIAVDITLTDRLPAGVTYAGWAQPVPNTNPSGVRCNDPTSSADPTCTLASLEPGASFTVYLTVQVTDGSLVPTDPAQVRTIENMSSVSVTSPADYLPGSNGSLTSCVRGACAITRVLMGDGVTNFTPSGGGGVFGPWALLLLGVPGLFLLRRRM